MSTSYEHEFVTENLVESSIVRCSLVVVTVVNVQRLPSLRPWRRVVANTSPSPRDVQPLILDSNIQRTLLLFFIYIRCVLFYATNQARLFVYSLYFLFKEPFFIYTLCLILQTNYLVINFIFITFLYFSFLLFRRYFYYNSIFLIEVQPLGISCVIIVRNIE